MDVNTGFNGAVRAQPAERERPAPSVVREQRVLSGMQAAAAVGRRDEVALMYWTHS